MIAIGASRHLPTSSPDFLVRFDSPRPRPGDHDIVVKVEASAINPVDTKIRASLGDDPACPPRILGWDAAGTVVETGPRVEGFRPGDSVYYAGDLTRPGCQAEFQAVDCRLVAHKPANLSFPESASIPLTALTAWELLFERMGICPDGNHRGQAILVINGAGGVGSLLIPLARVAGLRVIATASRTETREWCLARGAHHVIDHHQPLVPQATALGFPTFPWIANLHLPDPHWDATATLLAPMGTLGLIVEPAGPLRIGDPLKAKCARIAWEFMAARTRFGLSDFPRQGEILSRIRDLVERGTITPPDTRNLGPLDIENLREAHAAMESSRAHGKWVFDAISPN